MGDINKKPTITDVAKAVGVSKTTVSRYINGKYELMSEDTRERLRSVIEMTGYRPNDVARSLKSRQTKLIGVIISDISTPFSSALIAGIENELSSSGYIPLFVNCQNSSKKEQEYVKSLLNKGVEGLLVNSCAYENPFLAELDCKGFPVVLLDRQIKDHSFDIVTSEIESTIKALMQHLKDQGYIRPYMFTQELSVSSIRMQRHDIYLDAAEEIFAEADPVSLVRNINIDMPERTEKYLEDILKEPGTPAFMGVNTMTTLHLMNILKKMGVKIPEEAGVCGPDDWCWGQRLDWAGLIDPGITTFVINSEEIGRNAATLLLSRLDGSRNEKSNIVLNSEIVIRASSMKSEK